MGRKNIINQIEELELDHEEEHFEEHLDIDKKEKKIKNVFVLLNENDHKNSEKKQEELVVVEKPIKRKKNINQESSS
jgi:hypothetical protein